jgi:hypothetical protein
MIKKMRDRAHAQNVGGGAGGNNEEYTAKTESVKHKLYENTMQKYNQVTP